MKENKNKRLPHRPTDYKSEYNQAVVKLCRLGATDIQIADFFNICEKTLNNWKKAHPDFLQSIKKGKIESDSIIAQSLYWRAKGYQGKETKFFQKDGIVTDQRDVIVDHPPDTLAAIFWLKNRQSAIWRDKTETETTIKGSGLKIGFDDPEA